MLKLSTLVGIVIMVLFSPQSHSVPLSRSLFHPASLPRPLSIFVPVSPASSLPIIPAKKHKLNLQQRIECWVAAHFIRANQRRNHALDNKNMGKTSYILGLLSMIVLIIPFVDIASIPLAIMAISIGHRAKKIDPNDRKAKLGVAFGEISLVAVIVIIMILGLIVLLPEHFK